MANTDIARTPTSTAPGGRVRPSAFAVMRTLTEDIDRFFHDVGVNRWPFGLYSADRDARGQS